MRCFFSFNLIGKHPSKTKSTKNYLHQSYMDTIRYFNTLDMFPVNWLCNPLKYTSQLPRVLFEKLVGSNFKVQSWVDKLTWNNLMKKGPFGSGWNQFWMQERINYPNASYMKYWSSGNICNQKTPLGNQQWLYNNFHTSILEDNSAFERGGHIMVVP